MQSLWKVAFAFAFAFALAAKDNQQLTHTRNKKENPKTKKIEGNKPKEQFTTW